MIAAIITGLFGRKVYTEEFPSGIDTRTTDDIVITHNKNKEVHIIDCTFLDNAENQALEIANRICEEPVITKTTLNSFAINGYVQYGFKLRYEFMNRAA